MLSTERFQRYLVDIAACERVRDMYFERRRTPDIVRGPLALIRQSVSDHRCAAAYSAGDIAYDHTVTAVLGPPASEPLLKWLVAYVNSPLAQYYHFLTSTRWSVERANITQEEYLRMPFLVPSQDDERFLRVLESFDRIAALLHQPASTLDQGQRSAIRDHEDAMADLVFDLYALTQRERQLVWDMVQCGVEFFYWSKRKSRTPEKSAASAPPDVTALRAYAEAFAEVAAPLLSSQGQALNATVYQDGAPLSLIGFRLVEASNATGAQIVQDTRALGETLRRLDRQLLDEPSQTVYMRRHVRIYDGSCFYLVCPSERRFWSLSQARADADSTIVEWLSDPDRHGVHR